MSRRIEGKPSGKLSYTAVMLNVADLNDGIPLARHGHLPIHPVQTSPCPGRSPQYFAGTLIAHAYLTGQESCCCFCKAEKWIRALAG
jgi:hypothetical protein